MLEMILEPAADEAQDQNFLSGLRELVQQIFKDTETLQVNSDVVYQALDNMNIDSKEEIIRHLKTIEREGKFSRTRLDDFINKLEEVRQP